LTTCRPIDIIGPMQEATAIGHTVEGGELTELVLEVFRLNGRLLAAGDELVADLDLTSARWQVLGAVALSQVPQPVANIARNMGITRQAVQRIVNELEAAGVLAFAPNRHHQRAKLVVLTKKGKESYETAAMRQVPWINALAEGLSIRNLRCALRVVRALRDRLDSRASQEIRHAQV
jgi:DNA-binding MarR family transcriptional regulator